MYLARRATVYHHIVTLPTVDPRKPRMGKGFAYYDGQTSDDRSDREIVIPKRVVSPNRETGNQGGGQIWQPPWKTTTTDYRHGSRLHYLLQLKISAKFSKLRP